MEIYPPLVKIIIEQFKKLPGIGAKSAERIVEYLLKMDESEVISFADNLKSLKQNIKPCKICFSISQKDICEICADVTRENIIAVVEEYKDVIAMEKTGFHGHYHVLGGRIDMLEKISAENLTIKNLIERIEKEKPSEIIIATNPTPEGETTSQYLIELLKNHNCVVSKLATGIPVGAEIEYIDPETLKKSIENRRKP